MKRLPIGIQTFCDIVLNNYLYVDKTEKIFDLVNNPKGVYFLSRPRRFGKSLLISTLNEMFEGNKELFNGLWIYKADYAWKKHPVVRIDFSKKKAENKDDLKGFRNGDEITSSTMHHSFRPPLPDLKSQKY